METCLETYLENVEGMRMSVATSSTAPPPPRKDKRNIVDSTLEKGGNVKWGKGMECDTGLNY